MDIKSLYTLESHEKGAEMCVKDQFGKETDMYITIAGIDSKAWRNAYNDAQRKCIETADADSTTIMAFAFAAASIDWRGFNDKGKKLKFTQEKAEELYLCAPYIATQVDNFISTRINFMKI